MLSVKRFLLGVMVGLFLTTIFWSYSAYFDVSVPLIQGIIGSLVLESFCGMIAVVGNFDELMDNLPWL